MPAIARPAIAGRRAPLLVLAALVVPSACFYQPNVSDLTADAASATDATAATLLPTTSTTSEPDATSTTQALTTTASGTAETTAGVCGDGAIEGAEACDDGNAIAADGCESDCHITQITGVFAGTETTCALLEGGYLKCWGNGDRGRLGTGLAESIGDDEPASAGGLVDVGGKVVKVAVAITHTCALLEGGTIRCWGYGKDGRLGTGTVPGATCLDGQQNFQCELDPACCIGDDEHPGAVPPVDVGGLADDIVVGDTHSCALLAGGTIRCWGDSYAGQLGTGEIAIVGDDEAPAAAPPVALGDQAIQIFGGTNSVCAVLNTGGVRCWGGNGGGQLGVNDLQPVGDDEPPSAFPPIPLGGSLIALAMADEGTCSLLAGGRVKCWGLGGTLGYGSLEGYGAGDLPTPDVDIGGLAVELGAGGERTCARLDDGTVRCWGYGFSGALGTGDDENVGDEPGEMPPAAIDLGGTPVQLAIGRVHACALLDTNRLKCWGYNDNGQLGYGHTDHVGDEPGEMPPPDVPLFAE